MKRIFTILAIATATLFITSSCFIIHKGNKGEHKGNKKEHHDNGKHKGKKK